MNTESYAGSRSFRYDFHGTTPEHGNRAEGQQDAGFMREHMGKNRLAILPDVTHYETFMSPAMAAAVLPFINGANNAQSWADQVDAKQ